MEHGFLNIDKAQDWTSHDVVAKLRRLLKPFGIKKIGHAGTLDPFATGVLPIAIGASTRLIRFLPKSKRYMAEMNFDFLTDTDDLTGEMIEKNSEQIWTEESLRERLESMLGENDQLPPLYSARKHKGKRLYEMMRNEEEIEVEEIKTKKITIHKADLLTFEYPLAVVDISCSEGTYIRSIARDLGGHLTQLRRLESNSFKITESISIEDFEKRIEEGADISELFLSSSEPLQIPVIELDRMESLYLQQGREIPLTTVPGNSKVDDFFGCFNDTEFLGLAQLAEKKGQKFLQARVVL